MYILRLFFFIKNKKLKKYSVLAYVRRNTNVWCLYGLTHIRQEAYAAVLNIDLHELLSPPRYTPAVVGFEVVE